jgi:hypothetical protein
MTRLVWERARRPYGGYEYAYDELPQTGSFADRMRDEKLSGHEIDMEKVIPLNRDEAKKLKNRIIHREILWETVKNLSSLNRSFLTDKSGLADYSKYLATFLNLAMKLAQEYSGAVVKGDDFYIYEEPSVVAAIEITGVKKVNRTRDGKVIGGGYFWPL